MPADNKSDHLNSLWFSYVFSVLSAWNAELLTYPLDTVKTRLQVQGEIVNKKDAKLVGAPHRGTLGTAWGIVSEEGPLKLWQGLYAVLVRHLIYSGTRVVVYRSLKEDFFHQTKTDPLPLWKSAFCGVTAGAVAQYIASPADLLKVHLQMEGKRRLLGMPARVTGLVDAYRKVVVASGYRGLWKGAVPNVQRAALVNLGDLTTYDVVKQYLVKNTTMGDTSIVHFLSSIMAGLSATILGTPADVIRTRIMNQPLDEQGRGLLYKNTYDCLKKTIQNEGPYALYKGFFPIWFRLAPWAMVFWISYEKILYLYGADQF